MLFVQYNGNISPLKPQPTQALSGNKRILFNIIIMEFFDPPLWTFIWFIWNGFDILTLINLPS